MKKTQLVRNYFVLPCCLLLLNLVNTIISYKAELIYDHFIRVAVVILMIVVGSSLVGFLIAPGIESAVGGMHRTSKRSGGALGEITFILIVGLIIYWLYYRVYIHGPASILPDEWANPKHGR